MNPEKHGRGARASWPGTRDVCQGKYPKLCDGVEAHIEETFPFYRLAAEHHQHRKSTPQAGADPRGARRASWYYEPVGESEENLQLMRRIDEQYTRTPFYGSRRMTAWLPPQGYAVNRKRVSRLMEWMGIEAVYPKPNLSQAAEGHTIYPYLLQGVEIGRVNQMWSTDITYIRMARGFVYWGAVMDWFSRCVLSWVLSLTLEWDFCLEARQRALRRGRPEIFHSDPGPQFTSDDFPGELQQRNIAIRMDGRGRCLDHIFTERLWRSWKYEEVYWKEYALVAEAQEGIGRYLLFYHYERPHSSLGDRTPASIYLGGG